MSSVLSVSTRPKGCIEKVAYGLDNQIVSLMHKLVPKDAEYPRRFVENIRETAGHAGYRQSQNGSECALP